MTLATVGWSRTRERIAAGSIVGGRDQPPRSSNRTGWTSSRSDAPGRRHQRPDLAAPDEAPTPELDALQPTGTRPAADRGRSEMDVGGGQDLGRLGESDPVRRGGHRSVGGLRRAGRGRLLGLLRCARASTSRPTRTPRSPTSWAPIPIHRLSDDAAASLFEPSSEPEPSPPLFDAPDPAVVRRSFLAQPEPL